MFSKEYSLDWDDALPRELQNQWVNMLRELVGVQIEFDRIMPF